MPRKPAKQNAGGEGAKPIVTFDFEDRTYQIDTQRRKVYRRFVEIETSKAALIFSLWRTREVGA